MLQITTVLTSMQQYTDANDETRSSYSGTLIFEGVKECSHFGRYNEVFSLIYVKLIIQIYIRLTSRLQLKGCKM